MNYRRKPNQVRAIRWYPNKAKEIGKLFPIIPNQSNQPEKLCACCNKRWDEHAAFMYTNINMLVCPGMWVVDDGGIRLYLDEQFKELYEEES